jgi:hypothetical protein
VETLELFAGLHTGADVTPRILRVPSPHRVYAAIVTWARDAFPLNAPIDVGTVGFEWARRAKRWRKRDSLSPETSTVGVLFSPLRDGERNEAPGERISAARVRSPRTSSPPIGRTGAIDAMGALWARLEGAAPVELHVDGCPVTLGDFHVLEWWTRGEERLPLRVLARVTCRAFPLPAGDTALRVRSPLRRIHRSRPSRPQRRARGLARS